jgi:hypothetical protein
VMKELVVTFSDRTWQWMERYLSADELRNVGRYFTSVVERDLNERRCKDLEEEVRRELTKAGAVRIASLEIDEFARDARAVSAMIIRTGDPIALLVDGQLRLLVQDARKVVCSAVDLFGKRGGDGHER